MSALAATNHDIDEHNKHRVLPVPVGDSKIAFFTVKITFLSRDRNLPAPVLSNADSLASLLRSKGPAFLQRSFSVL